MGSEKDEIAVTTIIDDGAIWIENETLAAKAGLKPRPTVREQLRYKGALGLRAKEDLYEIYFKAALPLVVEWQCETYPDLNNFDLDNSSDPHLADLIIWLGMGVFAHVNSLDEISPNSSPGR